MQYGERIVEQAGALSIEAPDVYPNQLEFECGYLQEAGGDVFEAPRQILEPPKSIILTPKDLVNPVRLIDSDGKERNFRPFILSLGLALKNRPLNPSN